MSKRCFTLLLALVTLAASALPGWAQDRGRSGEARRATMVAGADSMRTPYRSAVPGGRADVTLEVPNLQVEQIKLEVEKVDARLALDARVANLVHLTAGADVHIGSVNLEISGVTAEAYLYVYLDNVAAIINRTLETLENNPEIIETLGATLQQTVGTVGDVAGQALGPGGAVSNLTGSLGQTLQDLTRPGGLLGQAVNSLGQTVVKTLDQAGQITETTLGQAGKVLGSKSLGSVADLTNVVSETTNQAGQTVRRVRDQAGNLIEYTLDQAGKVTGARVVEQRK